MGYLERANYQYKNFHNSKSDKLWENYKSAEKSTKVIDTYTKYKTGVSWLGFRVGKLWAGATNSLLGERQKPEQIDKDFPKKNQGILGQLFSKRTVLSVSRSVFTTGVEGVFALTGTALGVAVGLLGAGVHLILKGCACLCGVAAAIGHFIYKPSKAAAGKTLKLGKASGKFGKQTTKTVLGRKPNSGADKNKYSQAPHETRYENDDELVAEPRA